MGLMTSPVTVMDVAAYIIEQKGRMTTWKLQKLCYYAQAWSLVWDDACLFEENIEAWAGGPVTPKLYQWHKGRHMVSTVPQGADSSKLSKDQRETVDAVLDYYGHRTGRWLSELTHRERPWLETRRGSNLSMGERGNPTIPLDLMEDYYSGLLFQN